MTEHGIFYIVIPIMIFFAIFLSYAIKKNIHGREDPGALVGGAFAFFGLLGTIIFIIGKLS